MNKRIFNILLTIICLDSSALKFELLGKNGEEYEFSPGYVCLENQEETETSQNPEQNVPIEILKTKNFYIKSKDWQTPMMSWQDLVDKIKENSPKDNDYKTLEKFINDNWVIRIAQNKDGFFFYGADMKYSNPEFTNYFSCHGAKLFGLKPFLYISNPEERARLQSECRAIKQLFPGSASPAYA